MRIKQTITTEAEVAYIRIQAAVNYGEEEIPNDFPGRKGDLWDVIIDLGTGQILNWPNGRSADLHLTVKDSGTYRLLSKDGQIVASIENDYVPHGVIPGSYGDTIELTISGSGVVTNWRIPNADDFAD